MMMMMCVAWTQEDSNIGVVLKESRFVCLFQGWMGTGACPDSPLCLRDMSLFADIPKVMSSFCTTTVVLEPGQNLYLIIDKSDKQS